jgi:hypothetical protein
VRHAEWTKRATVIGTHRLTFSRKKWWNSSCSPLSVARRSLDRDVRRSLVSPVAVLRATTSSADSAAIALPIPLERSLSGVVVFAQGVVLDPAGAFFGLASFTGGLAITIGD